MSGEVWYGVGPKDVFPETFGPFLLGKPTKTASWRGMCLMCFLMTRRRGLGFRRSEGFGALIPASYCQRPRNRRGPIPQILALPCPRRRDSKSAMQRYLPVAAKPEIGSISPKQTVGDVVQFKKYTECGLESSRVRVRVCRNFYTRIKKVKIRANLSYKTLSGGSRVQTISQRPEYPAGFAVDIR
jgi:Isocitrate dehydrogenase kinase/phosphatase (AceK)